MNSAAWLVVALTLSAGWLIWSRLAPGPEEESDALETLFATVLCGVFALGFSALVLAEIGHLRPYVLAALLFVLNLGLWFAARRGTRGRMPARRDVAAVTLFTLCAAVLVAPASEDLLGGRDPGVYANTASWLARHGTLRIRSEPLLTVPVESRSLFYETHGTRPYRRVFFAGFFVGDVPNGEIIPQFLHLHPVYMAIGHWLAGTRGAFLVPPFFGVLAELAVFFFVRRLLGTGPALIAAVLLSLNLAQLWGVRNPYSEGLTQLGAFAALWALGRAAGTGGLRWAVLAGWAIGACLLVRVDAPLMLAAVAPAIVIVWASSAGPERWARVFLVVSVVFAIWGGAHGWIFSRTYTRDLMQSLVPLWSLTALVVALSAGALAFRARWRSILDRLHANGLRLWAIAAAVLVVAFAAGMWVRPHLEPFELSRRTGERTYNEETLIRVAWYLSTPGMLLGLAGVLRLLRGWLVQRRVEWAPFLAIFLAFSLFYFWNQRIYPDHPWAMRRFLPVVVPGICIGIAAAACWLWGVQRFRLLARAAAVAGVGLVVLYEAAMARPFLTFRDKAGVIDQLAAFARTLPERSVVLASRPGVDDRVATPLALHFERAILPLVRESPGTAGGDRAGRLFEAQVHRWIEDGRDVLYLTAEDGNSVFTTTRLRWAPVGTFSLTVPTFGVSDTGPPRTPESYRLRFRLVRASARSARPGPCAPLTVPLDVPLVGIAQGFFNFDGRRGGFRWAQPEARLVFPPCDASGSGRPHALRLRAACDARTAANCQVALSINGRAAGTVSLSDGWRDYEVPVPAAAMETGSGAVDIGFQAAGYDTARRDARIQAFRVGSVSLLGPPGARDLPMRHVFQPEVRPASLNLISATARSWGVRLRGFYRRERSGARSFRWTSGRAEVMVPLNGIPPQAIRVGFVRSSRPETVVRILANDCPLFEGTLPRHGWEALLPLGPCRVTGRELRISIDSDVVRPERDGRTLGVAVRHILLE